ncbi:MAG TPA: hypothetical protein VM938_13365 [Acidimicrobiales bacterium]|nr:hypothetical protein [Acidimicrobiales bacterium]
MAAQPPLTRLVLTAASVADDLGYVALSDLADVLGASAYRIIGGHMVTALVARWQLGAELYRETGDTDLGVAPVVVREGGVIGRLIERGYVQVEGNRFARPIDDVPVTVRGAEGARSVVVDVLVPSYRTRARTNHRVSDDLVTTEVPGLALALQREPVVLHMDLHRLNGERLAVEVAFPDEGAALTLKAFACQVRDKPTDVVDVWRCLEVAYAAQTEAAGFAGGEAAKAAAVVRSLFDSRDGAGMSALVNEQRLSVAAADERFTRIRALIQRVVPVGGAPHG